MSVKIDDPYRGITPDRWLELNRREYALRAAARRRFFGALFSWLRKAVGWCIASKPAPGSVQAR